MVHWSDDSEFMALLHSRHDDSEDKYGRDIVPPLPLAFDRVNEGRAPSSQAPLFSLPFEILGIILGYLPDNWLASLAVVNSDCRQLARSRQFASILLDYSDTSVGLVKKLVEEARARRDNGNNLTLNPSLGACIRRMTIATDSEWLRSSHRVWLENMQEVEQTQTEEPLARARRAFFDLYIPSIQVVLCDSLPHLELLNWKDIIWLRAPMFRALACSTVKHLKFSHLYIDRGLESIRPLVPAAREWPLRSLHFKLHMRHIFDSVAELSRFCANILSLCAMTLESIVLKLPDPINLQGIPQWFDLPVPRFPALRHLQLDNVDPLVLDALIPAGALCYLRTLEVGITVRDEVYSRFFNNRGCIQSLETFIWTCFGREDQEPVHFLHANPQLSKLALSLWPSPPFLEERVFPLLSRSFTRLSSLHLHWYAYSISESVLRLIGTLASLQQLHLSVQKKFARSPEWLVDHALLRTHLGTLPWLKRIALSQDTYLLDDDLDGDWPYYTMLGKTFRPRDAEEEVWADWVNSPDTDEPDNYQEPSRREVAWEAVHQKRMLAEAAAYARSMPRVEWLYFGQIPMQIERSRDRVTAVPLSTRRDNCNTLLSKMFGRDTSLD